MNALQKSALRHIVDAKTWRLLEEAEKHGDDSLLQRMRYVVKCETCGNIFLETSLLGAKEMYLGAKMNPDAFGQLVPFLWYVTAARHFLTQTFHSIRCFVIYGADATVVKDLSSEWKSQFDAQKQRLAKNVSLQQAMENELDYLEQLSLKTYGQK